MSSFDQFSVVQAWLQSIYGEDGVPEFEINAETVNALFEVATAAQRNTTNANLEIEAAKLQTETYRKKSTLNMPQVEPQFAKQSQWTNPTLLLTVSDSELSALISSAGLPTPQDLGKSKPSSMSSFDNPEKQIMAELVKVIVSLSLALDLVTTGASAVMGTLSLSLKLCILRLLPPICSILTPFWLEMSIFLRFCRGRDRT